MSVSSIENIVNLEKCPFENNKFINECINRLDEFGALTIPNFLKKRALLSLIIEAEQNQHMAYYSKSTHNVYLTPKNNSLPNNHIFNLQISSSKGCITSDQIPEDSALKIIYKNNLFKNFIAKILKEKKLYPYEDPLSSINVHYAGEGQELGWHFDNSNFAITLLVQKPLSGGVFEYVKDVRNSEKGEMAFKTVEEIVTGTLKPSVLSMEPGTLVLFRGKNSIHRVTPTIGKKTRFLVVFAYNSKPGVSLSKSAQKTFYGRVA